MSRTAPRVAQGTCRFNGAQRYSTALVLRPGEVPTAVELESPAAPGTETLLVVGCSTARDGEFSALSAVVSVALRVGTQRLPVVQAFAANAPYLTLICVGGYVPSVRVTAWMTTARLPPAHPTSWWN